MATVDWGSGVCASVYESYMKLSVSQRGTPRLLWAQLLHQVKHANIQVRGGEGGEQPEPTSHTLASRSKGRVISAAE